MGFGLRVWDLGVRVDPTEKVDRRFVNFSFLNREVFLLGAGFRVGVWGLGFGVRVGAWGLGC